MSKFDKIMVLVIAMFFSSLWGITLLKYFDARLNKLEEASTVAQQPQERHLFDTKVDASWLLESSDSAVIYREGCTRKIVTLYYSK